MVARGASSCTSLETTHGYWSSAEDAENAFLEDVFGDEALSFAKQMNAATVSALGEPTQSEYYEKVLAILESKDKVKIFIAIDLFCNFAFNIPDTFLSHVSVDSPSATNSRHVLQLLARCG